MHKEVIIEHYKAPFDFRSKVTDDERAPGCWGNLQFATHTEIERKTHETEYITNDNLCFEIVSIDPVTLG